MLKALAFDPEPNKAPAAALAHPTFLQASSNVLPMHVQPDLHDLSSLKKKPPGDRLEAE